MTGDDLHRIGGAEIENLRLKAREGALKPPGISALKASTPAEAALTLRAVFPEAVELHEAAKIVATTSMEKIRAAGFDVIPAPSRRLPNHWRIIHPGGAAGFTDENLAKLSQAFAETRGL